MAPNRRKPSKRQFTSHTNSDNDTDTVDDPDPVQSQSEFEAEADTTTTMSSDSENDSVPSVKKFRQTTLVFPLAKSIISTLNSETSKRSITTESGTSSASKISSNSETSKRSITTETGTLSASKISSENIPNPNPTLSVSILPRQTLSTIPCKQRRKKSSIIWKFFKECIGNPTLNVCMLCNHKTPNSNTSNSLDHVKRDHLSVYESVKERLKNGENFDEIKIDPAVVEKEKDNAKPPKKDTYRKIVKRCGTTYRKNHPKKKALDRAITAMMATDFQPFSMTNDKGFQKVMYIADPKYVLPSPNTVSSKLLPELYEEIDSAMKSTLDKLSFPYVSLTFDGWTSANKESFLGVTGHFIHQMKFNAVHLKMICLQDMSHTAENLSKMIEREVISKFPKIQFVCAVTDSAANMIATARSLQIKHMPCFAHKLQTVINKSILAMSNVTDTIMEKNCDGDVDFDDVERILKLGEDDLDNEDSDNEDTETISIQTVIKKCKRITQYFNKSTGSHAKLKKELKKQRSATSSLKQENNTRWNSTYNMFDSIKKAMDAITVVLRKIEGHKLKTITPEEYKLICDLLICLDPFLLATEALNGETYVSISLVIPTVSKLLLDLEEVICAKNGEKELKTNLGKEFASKLLDLSKQYLLVYETRSITAFASILDPRVKEDGFHDPRNYENQLVGLKEELKLKFQVQNQTKEKEKSKNTTVNIPPTPPTDNSTKSKSNSGLRKLFSKKITEKITPRKVLNNATAEAVIHLNNYTAEDRIDIDEDCPLQYWQNHPSNELRDLAMKYLSPPASSVPSERMFSTSGNIITEKRCNTASEKLDMLVALNKNLNVFSADTLSVLK